MSSSLRNRRGNPAEESMTKIPSQNMDECVVEFTEIPGSAARSDSTTSHTRSNHNNNGAGNPSETFQQTRSESSGEPPSSYNNKYNHSSSCPASASFATSPGGVVVATSLAMTGTQVAKDESQIRKILVRFVSGSCMISFFGGCVYMGHIYVCMIVALCQLLLFRELVKVRYNAHFMTIEDTIPLFRTTQWMWFGVAIYYTYGDFTVSILQNNQALHYLIPYAQLFTSAAFIFYSATFVTTIATMQVGLIKFQLNQLCWTIVVLCLTVGQMKYIMHNIFNGLIWFALPISLVVTNDIMAYVSGITCGRKFIHRRFISFSPNKTWEGFIGGGIFTMAISWYLSRFLAQYTWMTCPTNEFNFTPASLTCELDPIFQQAQSIFPPQMFEILPQSIVKMIPGIVEICLVKEASVKDATLKVFNNVSPTLTRCISGEDSHVRHHFELVLKNVYPIQIHALWLALFASLVAPFGGFLASAIKRAYGIKDFDSIIPGHGGVMDRMDCQFLMALCTWVHYNTFVKLAMVSVPKLMYMYSLLSETEKRAFVEQIAQTVTKQQRRRLEDYAF
jgi:phosphatidate cytidylyltransferase